MLVCCATASVPMSTVLLAAISPGVPLPHAIFNVISGQAVDGWRGGGGSAI